MERLKELRLKNNKTQQQMADFLKIQRASYTKYETGTREPDFDTLKKLAEIFGVSTDYMLGMTDNPATTPLRVVSIENKKETELHMKKEMDMTTIEKGVNNYFNEFRLSMDGMLTPFVKELSRRSGIPIKRLLNIARGSTCPTYEEFEAMLDNYVFDETDKQHKNDPKKDTSCIEALKELERAEYFSEDILTVVDAMKSDIEELRAKVFAPDASGSESNG